MYSLLVPSLLAIAAASPSGMGLLGRDSTPLLSGPVQGVATFNNYGNGAPTAPCGPTIGGEQAQCGQNCPNRQMDPRAQYPAASGDLSPNVVGVSNCVAPAQDATCVNGGAPPGYKPPTCTQTNCGHCYKVTNMGGEGGQQGPQNSVLVGIVDACPSNSAQNTCKNVVPRDRCAQPGMNALDIDITAYQALTGLDPANGIPYNLNITIEEC